MTTPADKPMRMIGLTRKSKGEDEGTHIDQNRIISDRCEREGFTLVRTTPEKGISGTKKWREREVGQALADIAAGKADGIIVAFEDRISRESMGETAAMWDEFRATGIVFIACDGVDSRVEGSNLTFAIKAAIARDKIEVTTKRSNMGRERAVMVEGVHGGDDAPLGYDWTERADGSKNVLGKAKHGPLTPNEDEARIPAAFEARDSGASWSQVVVILGVKSKGAAAAILRNRVYLGEARSGEYVNANHDGSLDHLGYARTHPPLVDADLFDRVQRELDDRATARREHLQEHPTETSPTRTPKALARIMRCACCAHAMTPSEGGYRCMYQGNDSKALHPDRKPYLSANAALPVVLELAKGWHRVHSPVFMLGREVDEAYLPVLREAEDAARQSLVDIEQAHEAGEIDDLAYARAATSARQKIGSARDARVEAEAVNGWLGMSPETVEERLADGDPETVNDFLRDTIRVMVYPSPYGKRRRCPVEERIKVQYLSAGRGLDPAVKYEPPVEDGVPVAVNIMPVETAPADQLPEIINPHGVPAVAS